MTNARSEFRIVYPILARPPVTLGEHVFTVLDCSERGLRLEPPPLVEPPLPGTALSGVLRLVQGLEWTFKGRLKRLAPDSWAIELDEESRIPIRLIYQEQRELRARFPDWR